MFSVHLSAVVLQNAFVLGDEQGDRGDNKEENIKEGEEKTPIELSEDFMGDLEDVKLDDNDEDSENEDTNDIDSVEDKFGNDEPTGNDEKKDEEINDNFWNDDEDEQNPSDLEEDGKKLDNEVDKDGKVDNDEQVDSQNPESDQKGKSNEEIQEPLGKNEGEMRADETSDNEEDDKNKNEKEEVEEAADQNVDVNGEPEETDEPEKDGEDEVNLEDLKLDNDEEGEQEPGTEANDKDEINAAENKNADIEDESEQKDSPDDKTEHEKNEPSDKEDEAVDDSQAAKSSEDTEQVSEGEDFEKEEDPVSNAIDPLPSDNVEPQDNLQIGAASTVSEQSTDEMNKAATMSSASSNEVDLDDTKDGNTANETSAMSYGDEQSGAKRSHNKDDFQTGQNEEEPVQKKGKIEDADQNEFPNRDNAPKENLDNISYQHVTENQKHDVQMFDDTKEKVENCYETENTEMAQEEGNDENTEAQEADQFQEQNEVEKSNINSRILLEANAFQPSSEKAKCEEQNNEEMEEVENDVENNLDNDLEEIRFDSSVIAEAAFVAKKDCDALRESLEGICAEWSEVVNKLSDDEATTLWTKYSSITNNLSRQLSDQIRIILEPIQSGRLKGDYRTGKRLNMKKLIPYIASGYRKDKIWLRRTKPQKRNYQIMIAIDDSSSMDNGRTRSVAFETIATLTTALALVEVGQIGVVKFGETCELIHQFNQPFSINSGANVLRKFSFKQPKTKIAELMKLTTEYMVANQLGSGQPVQDQLQIVVSDGRGLFVEGKMTRS